MGAQHTALWQATAEGDGGEGGVLDLDGLRYVCQEVQDLLSKCGTQSEQGELLHQGLWTDGVEGRGELQEEPD